MKFLPLLIPLFLLFNCAGKKDKPLIGRYQIFKEYGLVISAPCQFEIDSTLAPDTSMGKLLIMVCPQIFLDSSRTGFDPQKLLSSKNSVYHLRVLQNKLGQPTEFLLDQQRKTMSHFNISELEETEVDGKSTLIYDIKSTVVSEAYIPGESYIFYVAVSGDSSRHRLSKVLKTIKFIRL